MTVQTINTTELLSLVKQLSPREQLRVAEQILAGLAQQWRINQLPKQPLRSLLGLWQGFTVTEADIAEARQEM